MDMSALDVGTILAVLGLFYKQIETRAQQAEQMGRIKQQVLALEQRAKIIEVKLEGIDNKLGVILEAHARLEAQMALLLESRKRPILAGSLEGRD